jgi:hypothetical protein
MQYVVKISASDGKAVAINLNSPLIKDGQSAERPATEMVRKSME